EATISFYKKGLDERGNVDRRAWAASFLQAWAEAITYIAPSIKHPAFAAEKEWRLLRRLQLMDLPRMKFRQRQSMLARHLPVALRILGSPTESKLLPIVGVRVGPSRHKEISQVGVADLLRATGYPVSVYTNVSISEVPF